MKFLPIFVAFSLFTAATSSPAAQASRTLNFPKTNPEKEFSDFKIYDANGNPWRAAKEDWENARKLVTSDPAWKDWLKEERAALDSWMSKNKDRLTWICGWYHDFVSPKDNSEILWDEKIPGEEVPFLKSKSDPKIEITQKIMGGWVYNFRQRNMGNILKSAQMYKLTGEEKYAAWTAEQIDFYAENYSKWPLSTSKRHSIDGARLFWQTLDEAISLTKMSESVRLLGDYAKPERKAKWWNNYFKPQSDVLLNAPGHRLIHNIAMWEHVAVAQIAMVYQDEVLFKQAVDGPLGVREQVDKGITSDYFEWEQSFGYNSFFAMSVRGLFLQAGVLNRANDFKHEMAVIENLLLSVLYIRFPDGKLPLTADVTSPITVPDRKLYADYYRIFPTTIGLEEAATRRDWNTLVDPPVVLNKKVELPTVSSHLFESTRMALLKQGNWQVFFHFGQLTASHSQAEILNFMAYYGNTDITHDPGTVRYGAPMCNAYYRQGVSQNALLIDGEGQLPHPQFKNAPQYGELVEYKPNKVSASTPKYQPDTKASRTLSIEGNQLKDTASIEVQGEKARKLGLTLHLQGKVQDPKFVADPNFAQGKPNAFTYLKNPRVASYKDKATFSVSYTGLLMEVEIQLPGEFKVWLMESPDFPPDYRDCLYVEQDGTKATFVTTFTPKP